jgi:hypothetical protein
MTQYHINNLSCSNENESQLDENQANLLKNLLETSGAVP